MNNTQRANIVTAVSIGFSGLVGLTGNIFLVTILSKNLKKSKPYEKLIFATLLTDLCTCLSYVCLQPFGILGNEPIFCKIAGFFFAFFLNMNEVWIAINMFGRYLALYHKERYNRWFDFHGIMLCYFFAILVNMPFLIPLIYYNVFGLNNVGICGANPINAITTFGALCGQLFPFTSNVICFIFGYLIIRKIRSHISHVGTSLDSNLVEESRQIVFLVAISAIIPTLIQSPLIIIRIWQYFSAVDPWFSRILSSFFPLAPASAPFVTVFTIKPYRKKVVKFFLGGSKSTTTNIARINIVNH